MIHQTNITKKGASVILALFSLFLTSQEAKNNFKEYSKFSIVANYAILDNERDNNKTFQEINRPSYQLGFYYNVFQTGKFNFKTGLIAKTYRPHFRLDLTAEELDNTFGLDEDYYDDITEFLFTIPVRAEFYQPITSKLNAKIGLGFNFNNYTGSSATSTGIHIYNENYDESYQIFDMEYTQFQITFSLEAFAGLQYKFDKFMLDADFFITRGPDIATANYVIFNTINPPEYGGRILTNKFYGVSFTVTPKSWRVFKKKKE